MITINSIIDRLKATGNHGVMEYYLKEYCETIKTREKQRNEPTIITSWMALGEKENQAYTMIAGITWGLSMAGYITNDEQEKAIKELIAIKH